MARLYKTFSVILFLAMVVNRVTATPTVVSGGQDNDYESWIERLQDGRLMIIFARNPDWASGDLFVTFSSDDGVSWTEEAAIISEPGDQATLSFTQFDDGLLQLWYASNESGLYRIYSATSLHGSDWTQEGEIDLGWSDQPQYYDPTVVREPDGSLTMSYIVSGDGVYVAHQPAGGTWDTDRNQVNSSGYRARIMQHSENGYLCSYHRRTGGQYEYDVFVRQSDDLVDWSDEVRLTTNQNSHDPFAGQMPDGSYMVYYAKHTAPAYNLWRRHSIDGVTWEPEEQITTDNSNNTQPHFFTDSSNLMLVWAHAVSYPNNHDVYFERFACDPEPVRDLTIQLIDDNGWLTWSYDAEATFNIYWSDDPHGPFDNLLATTTATSLQLENVTQWEQRFYVVTVQL